MIVISYQDLGLANPKGMLSRAYTGGYAVPAFNFVFAEQLSAIVDACIAKETSFILQASAHVCANIGLGVVRHLAAAAAEKIALSGSGIQMALNLDHGPCFADCKDCIENGFSAVMIDGSALDFADNIALTREVVLFAHRYDVNVEGELGVLSGTEEGIAHTESQYTDPDAVREFVEKTGVDALAVSIGTCHGLVKIRPDANGELPPLRFDILGKIAEKLPGFPIVLHGSSCLYPEYIDTINQYGGCVTAAQGIPEDEVRKAAATAVCKINVASDGWAAAMAATRKALDAHRDAIDPRVFLRPAYQEMRSLYERKIDLFMCAGKR